MRKAYEETLPKGYTEALAVDGADKRRVRISRIVSVASPVAAGVVSFFIIRPVDFAHNFNGIILLILVLSFFALTVLHELLHGAVYKIFTGKKLKFGSNSSAVFCGVPDIFVSRRCALAVFVSPLVILAALMIALIVLSSNEWHKFFAAVMLGVHIGDCVGDLYCAYLLLFRFRDRSTLMRDTGPEQVFYTKK